MASVVLHIPVFMHYGDNERDSCAHTFTDALRINILCFVTIARN